MKKINILLLLFTVSVLAGVGLSRADGLSDFTGSGSGGGGGAVTVEDNLTSTSPTNALSANQGNVLDGKTTTNAGLIATNTTSITALIAADQDYASKDLTATANRSHNFGAFSFEENYTTGSKYIVADDGAGNLGDITIDNSGVEGVAENAAGDIGEFAITAGNFNAGSSTASGDLSFTLDTLTKMVTPNVDAGTATVGQSLILQDIANGQVEFGTPVLPATNTPTAGQVYSSNGDGTFTWVDNGTTAAQLTLVTPSQLPTDQTYQFNENFVTAVTNPVISNGPAATTEWIWEIDENQDGTFVTNGGFLATLPTAAPSSSDADNIDIRLETILDRGLATEDRGYSNFITLIPPPSVATDPNTGIYYVAGDAANVTQNVSFDFVPADVDVANDLITGVSANFDFAQDYAWTRVTFSTTGTPPTGLVAGQEYILRRDILGTAIYPLATDADWNILDAHYDGETVWEAQFASDQTNQIVLADGGTGTHTFDAGKLATLMKELSVNDGDMGNAAGNVSQFNTFMEIESDANGEFLRQRPMSYVKNTILSPELGKVAIANNDTASMSGFFNGKRYLGATIVTRPQVKLRNRSKTLFFDPAHWDDATDVLTYTPKGFPQNHLFNTGEWVDLGVVNGSVPTGFPAMAYVRALTNQTLALYPTEADANADTNRIDTTDSGSGDVFIKSRMEPVLGHTAEMIFDFNTGVQGNGNDHFLAPTISPVLDVIDASVTGGAATFFNDGRIRAIRTDRVDWDNEGVLEVEVWYPDGVQAPLRLDTGVALAKGVYYINKDPSTNHTRLYDDRATAQANVGNPIASANCINYTTAGVGSIKFTLTEKAYFNTFLQNAEFDDATDDFPELVNIGELAAYHILMDLDPAGGVAEISLGRNGTWDLVQDLPSANLEALLGGASGVPTNPSFTNIKWGGPADPHANADAETYAIAVIAGNDNTVEASILNAANEFVTTYSIPPVADTDPDQFVFTDITDATVSTVYESNIVTITGINQPSPITVIGGDYRVNGGAYTSAAGTVSLNDTVQVRLTSAATNSTTSDVDLQIGTVIDRYSVTTEAAASSLTPMGSIVASNIIDLDARDAASYSGTGTNIFNLEPTPADGTAQSGYNFTITNGTFGGTADDVSAEIAFAGTGYMRPTSNANTTFFDTIHRDDLDQDWAFAWQGDFAGTANNILCSTANGIGGSNVGAGVTHGGGANFVRPFQSHGAGFVRPNVGAMPSSGSISTIIVSYEHATNTVTTWVNGTKTTGVMIYAANASNPDGLFTIFADALGNDENTVDFKAFSAFNDNLSDADAAAILTEYTTRATP